MTQEEFAEAVKRCTHFLPMHYPKTVQERMQDIASSPYAELRSDNYGAGGFVSIFEAELAEFFGKEAAVFMPSGTMAQQIALRIWADEKQCASVAFHPMCHLERHEHMAYRELHHLESVLLGEPDRLFHCGDLEKVDRPLSSILIEFPQRDLGGQLPTWDEFQAIVAHAKSRGTRLHLDGARLWECGPYFARPYSEIAKDFDSVYVSFYKVLQGLPGALLAGPSDFIKDARIWMRRHGGNLAYMFPNAISAKIGFDRHLPRISEYVAKAAEIASVLRTIEGTRVVPEYPPTNMMHIEFETDRETLMSAVGEIALEEHVLLLNFAFESKRGCRTELSIGEAALDIPEERLRSLFSRLIERIGGPVPTSAR